jgi:hypothetical protein
MSVIMTPDELAARKRRNLWIAAAIAAFVVLVFLVTMVRVEDGIVAGAS